jgi:hypothetical protein
MRRFQQAPWHEYRGALASRYKGCMENRTEPRTASQWIRYIVVSVIAIGLVIWMLRVYIL